MMGSRPHTLVHLHWFEFLEIAVFILLLLIVVRQLTCLFQRRSSLTHHTGKTTGLTLHNWRNLPEIQLVILALPLHLLWEIAQFPLYTVWHDGDWGYILYGLVHCTLGDALIMLSAFWLMSLLNHTRHWLFSPSPSDVVLFTTFGLIYTIYSEIVNTRIKETWGYTEMMPIVPFIEIGGTPFMQWILIPPLLLWLIRLIKRKYS